MTIAVNSIQSIVGNQESISIFYQRGYEKKDLISINTSGKLDDLCMHLLTDRFIHSNPDGRHLSALFIDQIVRMRIHLFLFAKVIKPIITYQIILIIIIQIDKCAILHRQSMATFIPSIKKINIYLFPERIIDVYFLHAKIGIPCGYRTVLFSRSSSPVKSPQVPPFSIKEKDIAIINTTCDSYIII